MTQHPLTRLTAQRELEFRGTNGRTRCVTMRVGQPRRAGNDWVCPYEILGMPRARRRWAYGVDGVQALGLAYHVIAVELQALAKAAGGGRYWFLGEPGVTFPSGCSIVLELETRRSLRATGIRLEPYVPTRKQRRLMLEARRRTTRCSGRGGASE